MAPLLNLGLIEQHSFPYNWIKLDSGHFFNTFTDVLSCCVEKASTDRTEEFNGNGLPFPSRHQDSSGMHCGYWRRLTVLM